MVNICQRDRIRYSYSTPFLLAEEDSRGLFVQTDAKAFEFGFDESFVSEWFEDIEYYEDKIASPGDWWGVIESSE